LDSDKDRSKTDFEDLHRRVYRLCLALLGAEADAHDAAQEAIARAWLRRRRRRPGVSWWTWAGGFAVRVCREAARQRRGTSIDAAATLPIQAAASAEDADRLSDLYRQIKRLPERQCEVLTLRYLLERPIAEIAEILECPVGTVKSNLHKALVNMQSLTRSETQHDM
jgi:RNA polymerase sigma-70 factor (ECF subfamily)